eukprot:TRINITY_DN4771_c0_g1_i2.p1 TRINITY_DN4771_c0_g1~~TRINITY_DN4771_c0_g1_i2.p1  ORF type:complete len:552 (+),score=105.68 TRINITY_DN4771_c0_g1_i2:39-1694(+)
MGAAASSAGNDGEPEPDVACVGVKPPTETVLLPEEENGRGAAASEAAMLPSARADPEPPAWGKLVPVEVLPGQLGAIPLSGYEPITIGSSEDCTHTIESRLVCGYHCVIHRRPGAGQKQQALIEDTSDAGTWVNRHRIPPDTSIPLKCGDRVSLLCPGERYTFLYVELAEEAEMSLARLYDIRDDKIFGTGSFAVVKLCVNRKTGEKFAVKVIDKVKHWHRQQTMDHIRSEVQILKSLRHPNIISVVDIFETDRFLHIVLELVEGGDMMDYIYHYGALPEAKGRVLFRQLLEAVEYLHGNNIAHRDLKPANILISGTANEPILKVADFGIHCSATAPELLRRILSVGKQPKQTKSKHAGYGKEVDMWSLGVCLYYILSGRLPFVEDRPHTVQQQILEGDFDFLAREWNNISIEAKELIRELLNPDPIHRVPAETALQHNWFKVDESVKICNVKLRQPAPKRRRLRKGCERSVRPSSSANRNSNEVLVIESSDEGGSDKESSCNSEEGDDCDDPDYEDLFSYSSDSDSSGGNTVEAVPGAEPVPVIRKRHST